jgi:RimJ/RimL family protein N-acetyltransferase
MTLLDRPQIDTQAASIAVLETKRLVLRGARLEDAKRVAVLVNDRRIAENTARIPHPYTVDDATEWISAAISQPNTSYVITIAGDVIGACGVDMPPPPPPLSPTPPSPARGGGFGRGAVESRKGAEIGYWIGVPFWGCGYATEAARCLIDHAFGGLGYEVLTASARVSNPASRRVLEKCGFQWTGVGLCRIRAISSSVPVDRFRLERP